MKLKTKNLALIILIFIFGSISITSYMGLWKTTSDKVPATFKSGEFAGQYNPADIRGSYTFNDIHNNFNIPLDDLGKAFGIQDPSKYADFQVKELETIYSYLASEGIEMGTGSIRYFVALYKGLPYESDEGTYLSTAAVDILKSKVKLNDDQIKNLEKYSVDITNDSSTASSASSSTPAAASKTESEKTIKGTTTFKELLDWGIKKEDIEQVLNDKMPNSVTLIKDYASKKGVDFVSIKDPLQKLADTVK